MLPGGLSAWGTNSSSGRMDCGLLKTYRIPLQGSPKTMDLGLLYKALEQRQVSMVAGNATDGQLSVLDAVVLQDDQHYFPPYDCGLVVRAPPS